MKTFVKKLAQSFSFLLSTDGLCLAKRAGVLGMALFLCSFTNPMNAVPIEYKKANIELIESVTEAIQKRGDYKTDTAMYGREDYGMTITENNWAGDCEDWAITYRDTLSVLFPENKDAFKIMLVNSYDPRSGQNIAHAVLFVETTKSTYVLEGPSYARGKKYINSMKRLQATQYSKDRIMAQIDYKTPEYFSVVKMAAGNVQASR